MSTVEESAGGEPREQELRRCVLPSQAELDAALQALSDAVMPTLHVGHLIGRYERRYRESGGFTVEEGEQVPTLEDVGRVYAYQRRASQYLDRPRRGAHLLGRLPRDVDARLNREGGFMSTETIRGERAGSGGPSVLPTEADYEAAWGELEDVMETVELVTARVQVWVDEDGRGERTGPPPTLADIGALWTFADSLRLSKGFLSTLASNMERALEVLDGARRVSPGVSAFPAGGRDVHQGQET